MTKINMNSETLKYIINSYSRELPLGIHFKKNINLLCSKEKDYKYSIGVLTYHGRPLKLPLNSSDLTENFIGKEKISGRATICLLSKVLQNLKNEEYPRSEVAQAIVLYAGKEKKLREKAEEKINNSPFLNECKNYWELFLRQSNRSNLFLMPTNLDASNSFLRNIAQTIYSYKSRYLESLLDSDEIENKDNEKVENNIHFNFNTPNLVVATNSTPYSMMTLKTQKN